MTVLILLWYNIKNPKNPILSAHSQLRQVDMGWKRRWIVGISIFSKHWAGINHNFQQKRNLLPVDICLPCWQTDTLSAFWHMRQTGTYLDLKRVNIKWMNSLPIIILSRNIFKFSVFLWITIFFLINELKNKNNFIKFIQLFI